jgi:hypothetical protein
VVLDMNRRKASWVIAVYPVRSFISAEKDNYLERQQRFAEIQSIDYL